MADERFLVTGGTGCIGAWVVRDLVREGVPVTVVSSRGRLDRLELILTEKEVAALDLVTADVTDLAAIEAAARRRRLTHIVHLAALQLPFCAADPVAGARVNVQGTVSMFELARRLGIARVVYASSAAVYGPKTRYTREILPPDAELAPTSHYGVFKVANEQDARVWWEANGVASIGLRPHSVYGPGRDQGATSKPTLAMIAAAAGRTFRIDYSGRYQFQFADDVARTFINAARSNLPGANVFSLPGPVSSVGEIVGEIEKGQPTMAGRITVDERLLALPAGFDGSPLEKELGPQQLTPLAEGVHQTIEAYRSAIRDGRLGAEYLDRVLAQ